MLSTLVTVRFILPRFSMRLLPPLLALATLSGCATRQPAPPPSPPAAKSELPVEVSKVLVVYRPASLNRVSGGKQPDEEQGNRDRMVEAFGDAVESRIPAGLIATGIPAKFVRTAGIEALRTSPAAQAAASHMLYVRIETDTQVCPAVGNCSHQLTVRVSMQASGGRDMLWQADLREPEADALPMAEARYDALADRVLKVTLGAIRLPQ